MAASVATKTTRRILSSGSGPTSPKKKISFSFSSSSAAAAAPSAKLTRTVAGAGSALIEIATLQPLDVVKTRMQLGYKAQHPILGSQLLGVPAQIARQEGPRALYKGMVPLMTSQSLKYATRHGMFQTARSALWGTPEARGMPAPAHINLLAGLLAGMAESVVITTPFEVVKIRMQSQKGRGGAAAPTTAQTAVSIISQEGFLALWKGVLPTMMRGGTNQACNFLTATAINQHVWGRREGDGKQIAVWKSMTTGFVAGCIGPLLNNPLDVAKTRMMAQAPSPSAVPKTHLTPYYPTPYQHPHHASTATATTPSLTRGVSSAAGAVKGSGSAQQYRGMVDCIRQVAQKEGVLALWNGIAPRLLRTGLGQAISWTVVTRAMASVEALKQREQQNS